MLAGQRRQQQWLGYQFRQLHLEQRAHPEQPDANTVGTYQHADADANGHRDAHANTAVNRDFNDLWLRFVSSVSNFVRQNEVDNLLRASIPSAVSNQQVRKSSPRRRARYGDCGSSRIVFAEMVRLFTQLTGATR